MSKSLLYLCLILGLVTLSLTQEAPSLVVNIFRHGARAPIKDNYDKTWAKAELGQLTPVGARMHYIYGASLAKKYPHLLGKVYDDKKVYVRSSGAPRCIASALNQLNGAFKGPVPDLKGYPEVRAEVPFDQEIVNQVLAEMKSNYVTGASFDQKKIVSIPQEQDFVLKTPDTCPALYFHSAANLASSKFVKFWRNSWSPVKDQLKIKGLDVFSPFDNAKLSDTMIANHYSGKAIPGKVEFDSDLYKSVMMIRDWTFSYTNYGSEKQTQLLSVPLFEEIFKYMDAKTAGRTTYDFVFLSTHDTAQMTILKALGIVNEDCILENYNAMKNRQIPPKPHCKLPPFASNILMEYFANNGKPYVVFKYNDKAVPLCNGQTNCPYEQFKALVAKSTNNYKTKDYESICKNSIRTAGLNAIGKIKGLFGGKKAKSEEPFERIQ